MDKKSVMEQLEEVFPNLDWYDQTTKTRTTKHKDWWSSRQCYVGRFGPVSRSFELRFKRVGWGAPEESKPDYWDTWDAWQADLLLQRRATRSPVWRCRKGESFQHFAMRVQETLDYLSGILEGATHRCN